MDVGQDRITAHRLPGDEGAEHDSFCEKLLDNLIRENFSRAHGWVSGNRQRLSLK